MTAYTASIVTLFIALSGVGAAAPPPKSQAAAHSRSLSNPYYKLKISREGAISALQVDPGGKNKATKPEFARYLAPDNWEALNETRITGTNTNAVVGPLRVWRPGPITVGGGASAAALRPEKLLPGQTLSQTFSIPGNTFFDSVSVHLPTWNTTTSGVTLRLYEGRKLLSERKIINAKDNAWQEIKPPQRVGAGVYRVEIADPIGEIGWWSSPNDIYPGGSAGRNSVTEKTDRTLRIDARQIGGEGTLRVALKGPTLTVNAEMQPSAGAETPLPDPTLLWKWRMSWTKQGYDCTPKTGILFQRFFTDNQRYLSAAQLKRRNNAGLSFEGCRWVEMEGTRTADLRFEGERLRLDWQMAEREMALHFRVAQLRPEEKSRTVRSVFRVTALARQDSAPANFPRFRFSNAALSTDTNHFWWERNFSYPSPALPAAWFEWEAISRCWVGGAARDGEMRQLETYPITPNGYVHTWGKDIGWPLRPRPTTDTRHADTNARFLLACWRYWRWTGDMGFLQRQADRLRRAMRYQLENLHGADGLIITESADVQGRHGDQGNNYWDILPFGYLDAYANAVFYASLEAMQEMDAALSPASSPSTDYAALRVKARERYNAVFWDNDKGRYIGCVDSSGGRHDYGFTFVNIEALYYGLGDIEKAKRIYHWMETEPTSSGKPDTYSRFVFAPRATTLHNPQWGAKAPLATKASAAVSPWWVSWWHGTPYGDQCQDGGAILYVSYFDLMVRQRFFGSDNAWKRWEEILTRYRLPDHLSGGAPLFTGEKPQQEDAGQVGVDFPFPESGMVPCFLLYGVAGIEATPDILAITPRLPKSQPFIVIQGLVWREATLSLRITAKRVEVRGNKRDGSPISVDAPVPASGTVLIPVARL